MLMLQLNWFHKSSDKFPDIISWKRRDVMLLLSNHKQVFQKNVPLYWGSNFGKCKMVARKLY